MEQLEFTNAPKRLKPALAKLYRAETLLEDLARAVEIAEVTGQIELVTVFRQAAEEYLQDKLQMADKDVTDIKLRVATNLEEEEVTE